VPHYLLNLYSSSPRQHLVALAPPSLLSPSESESNLPHRTTHCHIYRFVHPPNAIYTRLLFSSRSTLTLPLRGYLPLWFASTNAKLNPGPPEAQKQRARRLGPALFFSSSSATYHSLGRLRASIRIIQSLDTPPSSYHKSQVILCFRLSGHSFPSASPLFSLSAGVVRAARLHTATATSTLGPRIGFSGRTGLLQKLYMWLGWGLFDLM
jgi:hypothetical protein